MGTSQDLQSQSNWTNWSWITKSLPHKFLLPQTKVSVKVWQNWMSSHLIRSKKRFFCHQGHDSRQQPYWARVAASMWTVLYNHHITTQLKLWNSEAATQHKKGELKMSNFHSDEICCENSFLKNFSLCTFSHCSTFYGNRIRCMGSTAVHLLDQVADNVLGRIIPWTTLADVLTSRT